MGITSSLESFKLQHVVRQKDRQISPISGGFFKEYGISYSGAPCVAKGVYCNVPGKTRPGTDTRNDVVQTETLEKLCKECVLHSKLRHPNIVQFIGVEYSGQDPKSYDLLLVTERIDTDLSSLLAGRAELTLPIKLSILRDVSAGLLYLHSLDSPIVHCDLTLTNILITQDQRAKIAEFGSSIESTSTSAHIPLSNFSYMPPEVLSTSPSRHDSTLDIFSFGIVTLCVSIQTTDIQLDKQNEQVKTLQASNGLQCLSQIVSRCCEEDPSKRPSSHDLYDHLHLQCMKSPVSHSNADHLMAIQSLEQDKAFDDTGVAEIKKELAEVIATKDKEISELKSKIEILQYQANVHKEDFDREREDRIKARSEIEILKKELDHYKFNSVTETVGKDKGMLEEIELKERNQQASVLAEDFGRKRKDHENTPTKWLKMEEELRNTKSEIQVLKEELQVKDQQLKQYEKEMESCKAELDMSKHQALVYQKDFDCEREDRIKARSEIENLSIKLDQYKLKFKSRSQTVEDMQKKEEIDPQKINSLEEQLRVAQKENEQLRDEMNCLLESYKKMAELSEAQKKSEDEAKILEKELELKGHMYKEMLEQETAKHLQESDDIKRQLKSVKENLDAMETLTKAQLKDLNTQLHQTTEELAVKVAQVKQYQKQVETYKSHIHDNMNEGVRTPTHASQIEQTCVKGASSPCLPPSVALATQTSPNEGLKSSGPTIDAIQAPHSSTKVSCEPDGDSHMNGTYNKDDIPPPIHLNIMQHKGINIADAPLNSNQSVGMKPSSPVPHPKVVPLGATYVRVERGNGPPHAASIVPWGANVYESLDCAPPLDPNLKCPMCRTSFRKGEIQLFKRHAEVCMRQC